MFTLVIEELSDIPLNNFCTVLIIKMLTLIKIIKDVINSF